MDEWSVVSVLEVTMAHNYVTRSLYIKIKCLSKRYVLAQPEVMGMMQALLAKVLWPIVMQEVRLRCS